jgi:hypothetical protein
MDSVKVRSAFFLLGVWGALLCAGCGGESLSQEDVFVDSDFISAPDGVSKVDTPEGVDVFSQPDIQPDTRVVEDVKPTPDGLIEVDTTEEPDLTEEPDVPEVPDVPEEEKQYDLDGDGVGETDLLLAPCSLNAESTCLVADSDLIEWDEVHIADNPNVCLVGIQGSATGNSEIHLTGDHTGDGVSELTVSHCPSDGVISPVTLTVIDGSAGVVQAQVQAPNDAPYVYVAHPKNPMGHSHPLMAPGDGNGSKGAAWPHLCVYRPDLASNPACGTGFSAIPIPQPPATYREAGGLIQDINGDGWDDVHLIYHAMIWYGSIHTLSELTQVEFDVAASTEPNYPVMFHSGRNYGTHKAFVSDGGDHGTVIVGGAPVGSFTDYNCNVSRFVAVLSQSGVYPGTRQLAWSHYLGFASTIFATYDPVYTINPEGDIARAADVMDDCIHRFSDSRTVMDGQRAVMINYFQQDAPVDLCLNEQWALYQAPTWTDAKADTWYGCFAKNVASMGVWGMQLFRESDGLSLTGGLHHYVWGWSDQLLPSGEVLYLLELLPGSGRFDLADRSPSTLAVYALVEGLWTPRGTFPVVGRPLLQNVPATGNLGTGSFTYISELTLADSDEDGLMEVQLKDGSWVEFSIAADAFSVF